LEIGPRSADERTGLEHIAEAARRDGAQVAAHDKALHEHLEPLSTGELEGRRMELIAEAAAERANQGEHHTLSKDIAGADRRLDLISERAERIGDLPRRARKPELQRMQAQADSESRAVDRWEAELRELPPVAHEARAEAAVVDRLLAQRERAELAALRIAPPDYIAKELGERPQGRIDGRSWDHAAKRIEGYRKEYGIEDRDTALGARPAERGEQRERWERTQRQLAESRRQLGREQDRGREAGFGIEHGMGIGR
jgi:hypothetical protein